MQRNNESKNYPSTLALARPSFCGPLMALPRQSAIVLYFYGVCPSWHYRREVVARDSLRDKNKIILTPI